MTVNRQITLEELLRIVLVAPLATALLAFSSRVTWFWYGKLYPFHKRTGHLALDGFVWVVIWMFFLVWVPIALAIIIISITLLGLCSVLFGVLNCQPKVNYPPRGYFVKPDSGRRKLSGREYATQLWRLLCLRLWKEEGDDPHRAGEARIPLRVNPRTGRACFNRRSVLPEEPKEVRVNHSGRWTVGPNGEAIPPGGEIPPIDPRRARNIHVIDPSVEEIVWVNLFEDRWITAPNGEAIPPRGELRSGMMKSRRIRIPWEVINLCGITHAPPGDQFDDGYEDTTTDIEGNRRRDGVQGQKGSEESNVGYINAPQPSQPVMGK